MPAAAASLRNAWTGGQYSAVRALVTGTVAVALARDALAGGSVDPLSASLAAMALVVAAGIGVGERLLSGILASAVAFGSAGGLSGAAVQIASLWLSAHLLVPRGPYGSLAARGRTDPGGNWSLPAWYPAFALGLFAADRLWCASRVLFDGSSVLAAAFVFVALLAVFRKTALAGWALSLVLGLALAWSGRGSFSAAWLLHLIAFQPAWIPKRPATGTDAPTVFYDGTCALCHAVVRFLLVEDREPVRFRLAPLQGRAFAERVHEAERLRAPDSVVVLRDGKVLVKSAAVVAILEDLGGLWWMACLLAMLLPQGLLDRAYDFVAGHRYRWFGRKADACPLMPPALRARIDA